MPLQTQNGGIAMTDSSPLIPLFDGAVEDVRLTVLHEHMPLFQHRTDAAFLFDALRALDAGNDANDTGVASSSRRFALFLRTFAPYFDVLSICATIKLEWVECFWNLIHVVLKTSSENRLFMEKTSSIFEAIAHILPHYQQIYETCKRDIPSLELDVGTSPLAALMSVVFADIVQLCLDLYSIAFRIDRGHILRDLTSGEGNWRPLDSRFSRLETRLAQHRKWLEKETRNHVQPYAEIAEHRIQYLDFVRCPPAAANSNNTVSEHARIQKRLKRIERICIWLGRGFSLDSNDGNHTPSAHGSCDWFLKNAMYRYWKDCAFKVDEANRSTLKNTWQHRILFVQAIEGFGKSILSEVVRDDLVASADDPEAHTKLSTTTYFRFTQTTGQSSSIETAFRTISTQLLTNHRHDRSTLDLVCLLSRRTSLCDHATFGEVLDTISLLLQQHSTYVIFDGIENCADVEQLLQSVARLCRSSDARVIIFSRPNIRIPLEYQKWASDAPHILTLTPEYNVSAIEAFITGQLESMAERGWFNTTLNRDLLPRIAHAAEGSFLWASLAMRFLVSPLVTADERHIILDHIQALAGLEVLYRNIFSVLERRPEQEKCILANTFRWLSLPTKSLDSATLQAAIGAGERDSVFAPATSDLFRSKADLSCGLLRFEKDSLSFAHPSINRYLRSAASFGAEFSLHDESTAHAYLAAQCLSYLAHTMPKQPLGPVQPTSPSHLATPHADSGASLRTSKSGDSGYKSLASTNSEDNTYHHNTAPPLPSHQSDSQPPSFDAHLPFLRYATLQWPIHLSRSLALPNPPSSIPVYPYIPALHALLSSRLAVTAWVEASYRYHLPPSLTRLVGPLSDLTAEIPANIREGRELRVVLRMLKEVSEQLVELKRGYEGVLRSSPWLIWRMDAVREREEFWGVQ